jgi:hypothetical protein
MSIEQRENYISIVERIAAHLSQHVDPKNIKMKNTHLILEALYDAKQIEISRQKERLEQTRKELIKNQNTNPCTSLKRVLFQYKKIHIKQDDLLTFMERSYLLKYIPAVDLANAAVILMDLRNSGVSDYCIEECILYSQSHYEFKKKIQIQSRRGDDKRMEYLNHCQDVDKFNKNLSLIWEKLNLFEKLKHFCKPAYINDFEAIIEKGHNLNLSDQRIKQLIMESNLLNAYEDFTIPFKTVDPVLKEDVTNFSFDIASKLVIPEDVILDKISRQDILKGSDFVFTFLGLDRLKEFEVYWKEITYFKTDPPKTSSTSKL